MGSQTIHIAIFASGSGSNAQKLMEYFKDREDIKIVLLLSNTSKAYALERAKNFGIHTYVFNRNSFYNTPEVLDELKKRDVKWIVLAGFLWLIPENLLKAYPDHIVNIHPALLPAYGGHGMYGKYVHEAVAKAGDKESGITIHLLNERYDEGEIVFQAKCALEEGDTAEEIARKVQLLEHEHFPQLVEQLITTKNK